MGSRERDAGYFKLSKWLIIVAVAIALRGGDVAIFAVVVFGGSGDDFFDSRSSFLEGAFLGSSLFLPVPPMSLPPVGWIGVLPDHPVTSATSISPLLVRHISCNLSGNPTIFPAFFRHSV